MRVLVVEDDPTLLVQLGAALGNAGYAVDEAADGRDGLHLGLTEPYDAIVLDLGLPVLDGLTVLQRWRQQGRTTPVLILTARDGWHEKVAGIDAGADDYLTKPFHTEELLARLRALVRRSHGLASPLLRCGDVTLDTRAGTVTLAGATVSLTAHEYRLLAYLMHRAGQVVSRSELVEHLYAQDFDRDSNTIEVFVGRLRRKLGAERIETVRGLGYRLVPPEAHPATR
ncbi:MAG: response regulator transcription factor [Burkholderiales bacterium]|nr:response regulator transcription factor [Burkholderiales bacterium]